MSLKLDFHSPDIRQEILAHVSVAVGHEDPWARYLARASYCNVHVAVMNGPYLGYIFEGKKTIESRFSKTRRSPYERVRSGDIVLFKVSGGPIIGVSIVSHAWFYRLDRMSWKIIKRDFFKGIRAKPNYWTRHKTSMYATLIRLGDIRRIPPVLISKKDRRPWVILRANDKASRVSEKTSQAIGGSRANS